MRIGIDIRALMEGKTTGVEVYIRGLLQAMFALDQKNDYVLFANSFTDVSSKVKLFSAPNLRYVVSRVPNKLYVSSQKLFGFPDLEKMTGKLEVFFSPHWRVTALRRNLPTVVTFHDLSFELVPEFFTRRQRYWHRFMNFRKAATRSTRIIAVSESTKRDLVDLYAVKPEKIRVVYPGPGLVVAPDSVSSGERDYFLCFATQEPRKNLEGALAAYELYRRMSRSPRRLVIAGSRGWIGKLSVPPRLRPYVELRSDVSELEKTELFRSAFAFIFVSFYEGFGFPALEAARSELPVIVSRVASLQEIARDFGIFINPFRPAQIAESMFALENDQPWYEDRARKARQASEKYSWERAARETLNIFSEAAR